MALPLDDDTIAVAREFSLSAADARAVALSSNDLDDFRRLAKAFGTDPAETDPNQWMRSRKPRD